LALGRQKKAFKKKVGAMYTLHPPNDARGAIII